MTVEEVLDDCHDEFEDELMTVGSDDDFSDLGDSDVAVFSSDDEDTSFEPHATPESEITCGHRSMSLRIIRMTA